MMNNNTIDAKLLNAQVTIDNALGNSAISEAVANFGYNKTKLLAGKALYETALKLHNRQKVEYGEQYAATSELETALSKADKMYMVHLKVARIALRKQISAAEALRLNGQRKKTYSGWIEQTTLFYENALASAEIKAALAGFGIDLVKLKAGEAAVNEVRSLLAAQLKEKGEAQAATKARDEALDALMEWFSDFIVIARIALENDPQLLEILGIVVES
jgi:hypothetical protein